MREIKYRGRTSDGQWVFGNLVILGTGQVYIIPQNIIANSIPQYSVDPETIGEYTGLKDKNGKGREMFEGDVYYSLKRYFVIEWSGDSWKARNLILKSGVPLLESEVSSQDHYEYIGSIYEHPHLLEGGVALAESNRRIK